MKVKKEVKDLFIEFKNEKIGSKRWHEIENILINKYKFTVYNLSALWQYPPAIEYTIENINLIKELNENKKQNNIED